MSSESNRNLLTVGIFFLIIVVSILLFMTGFINDWVLIVPTVMLFLGLWLLVLAVIRVSKPAKYERSPFSTLTLGLCAMTVGGAWFLFRFNWLYSLVVILLLIAVLAIAAAFKRK